MSFGDRKVGALLMVEGPTYLITAAQMRAMNTTPFIILPAEPGFFHLPKLAHLHRYAGTAYTIGAATALQARLTGSPGTVELTTFNTEIFSNAGPFTCEMQGPTTAAGTQFSSVEPSSRNVGDTWELFMAGGNISGGSGDFEITVFHYRLPNAPLRGPSSRRAPGSI